MKQAYVILCSLLFLQVAPVSVKGQVLNEKSSDANKKLISDFYHEVWGKGNLDFADKVFQHDYIRHDLRTANPLPGPEGQKKVAEDFRKAFPDLTISIDLIIATDEFVTARWTMSGTQTGTWGKIKPTNKKATFSGVNIFRMEDGKVKEVWNHRDDFGLFEQLGIGVKVGGRK